MKLKLSILFMGLCLVACKNKTVVPDTGGRTALTRDSIFLYAKEVYLWNDALPTYQIFNPNRFTTESTDFLNYEKELIALTQYKINPSTNKPYEYYANGTDSKYSYISDLANKNPVAYVPTKKSSVDLAGNGNDFGLKITPYGQGGTTFALFVTAVYPSSPADKAGMVRSNRIYKINGRSIGDNYELDRGFINDALNGTTITLEGVVYTDNVGGAAYTKTLTKAVYKSSPILATKVFTAGAKKIGYLAYARFSTLSNSKPDFDAAFDIFSTAGVTDLIVDLRYNGGGYVETARYLINQIAPSSISNGSVMYSEHYNSTLQGGQVGIMKNQPLLDANGKVQYSNGQMVTYADVDYSVTGNTVRFQKAGPLTGLNNVVFIVSGNTASASELVINSLKPYMNVKLVGDKTYGKPVGFFPITLENKYEVYYSMFLSKNSQGQGDYFDGFVPDVLDNFDDPRYNFGEARESYIAQAINLLSPSAPVITLNKTMSIQGKSVSVTQLKALQPIGDSQEFVGMIETKHTRK